MPQSYISLTVINKQSRTSYCATCQPFLIWYPQSKRALATVQFNIKAIIMHLVSSSQVKSVTPGIKYAVHIWRCWAYCLEDQQPGMPGKELEWWAEKTLEAPPQRPLSSPGLGRTNPTEAAGQDTEACSNARARN